MSVRDWLRRIFVPEMPADDGLSLGEQRPLFEWNQNMRIVTAIAVTFVSALIMWWIVA